MKVEGAWVCTPDPPPGQGTTSMASQLGHLSPTLHHRHSSLGRPSQGLWEPDQKPSLDLVLPRCHARQGVVGTSHLAGGGGSTTAQGQGYSTITHDTSPAWSPYPTSQGLQDRPAVNAAVSLLPSNHNPPEGGGQKAGVGGY